MSEHDRDDDGGNLVVDRPPTEDKQRMDPPPKYAVIFLNDDFTPMDFVVEILVNFFGKTMEQATALMIEVHESGKAMVASYPKDIAETKVAQVNLIAQQNEHPFKATCSALN